MPGSLSRRTLLASLARLGLSAAGACASDWPEWRGPQRNGISQERDWFARWDPKTPPRIAWRKQVGKGHSIVSVSQGRCVTLGWDGENDTVVCFDAATGHDHWRQSYPCKTIVQWPGPRASATLSGEFAFTLGQWGQLACWRMESGKPVWQRQLKESYNPDVDYGFAWSPLLLGDLLILGCGSRGLALDARTGEPVWGDDGKWGACSSAVPFPIGKTKAVAVVVTDENRDSVRIVGVDLKGVELFRSDPWPEKWGAACVDLLVHENQFFITTAEQHRRSARFSLIDGKLREDWSTNKLAGYTGGCVRVGDSIYTVDARGILKCLDWETGNDRWAQRGFDDRGTLMAAGGMLVVQAGASGDLVIAAANPKRYEELRRTKVFERSGDTFTVPVLANDRIYCRSYAGEVACLDFTKD